MKPNKIIAVCSILIGFVAAPVMTLAAASASEVAAIPGWNASLAFSPASNEWLVASAAEGKIVGVMMTDTGKTVRTSFTISSIQKNNFWTKTAYDPVDNKFLVTWLNYPSGLDSVSSIGVIYGQFLDSKGSLTGSNFKISEGKGLSFGAGDLRPAMLFDSKNKKFVLSWEIFSSPPQIVVNTIGIDGSLGTPTILNGSSGMSALAVNTKANEYCIAYRWTGPSRSDNSDASSLVVQSVNAATGAVGSPVFVADDIFVVGGIAYDPTDSQYLVVWRSYDLETMYGQFITSCSTPSTTEPFEIAGADGPTSVSYNPKSNSFAVIAQDQDTALNNIYLLDSTAGSSIVTVPPLFGAGKGNFNPVVAANPVTGAFAAISSQDHSTVRFVSNLGMPEIAANKTVIDPLAKSTTPPLPNKGLPSDLGAMIESLFNWSLNIIGLVIFSRFFFAGFKWFTAQGNPTSISDAKEIMKNAAYGAVVLFAAYLILYTINPDLVKSTLNLPGLPACNTSSNPQDPCGSPTPKPGTPTADTCVHVGLCEATGISCSWVGNAPSDCDVDDFCAPQKSTCKASGKTCTTDKDCI